MGEKSAATRLQELDVFRGLAAVWVMMFHFTTRYAQLFGHPRSLGVMVPNGELAVHLFFMISGFVIFMTLHRCSTGLDFVVSRVSRLYPPYWVAVGLTSAVGLAWPLPGQEYSATQILGNLTMLQSFLGVRHIDGVYWSLAWELGFYAVMLGLFLGGAIRRTFLISAVWIAAAVAAHLAGDWPGGRVRQLLTLDYAPLFLAGVHFHEIWRGQDRLRHGVALAACWIADVVLFGPTHAVFAAGCFAAFFLAVTGRLRFLCRAPLVWLGGVSYSLYLTHEMLGFRLMKSLYAVAPRPALVIPAAVLAALTLAWLMNVTVEKPVTRGIRVLYRSLLAARMNRGGATVASAAPGTAAVGIAAPSPGSPE